MKEKTYLLRIIILIIGFIMQCHIINSYYFKWIKIELLNIKGIKLYSLFKIIEYILLMINKFSHDFDLQLLKIITAKKTKHKIFTFFLLSIFLYAHIYIFILFYYCTWLIINDNNKSFFSIYLKVNYIEFKQSNKSFKSIHYLLSNDINDRFLNYFILLFIFINGYIDGIITINISNIYFKRILICFIAEIISDYLKAIILFKLSNINPKEIKLFLKEEIIYYKKIKNKEKINNITFNCFKNNKLYEQYLYNAINYENIFPMLLNINILPFCIIFLYFFIIKIKLLFVYKIIIFLILIGIKILNGKMIDNFQLNNYSNNNKEIIKNLSELNFKYKKQ